MLSLLRSEFLIVRPLRLLYLLFKSINLRLIVAHGGLIDDPHDFGLLDLRILSCRQLRLLAIRCCDGLLVGVEAIGAQHFVLDHQKSFLLATLSSHLSIACSCLCNRIALLQLVDK